MVKYLHLPHGGLCSRVAVEDQGVAAGIKSEALASGYVYLGDKTAALFFGVLGDQVLGLVAQDLAALVLESLVGMELV